MIRKIALLCLFAGIICVPGPGCSSTQVHRVNQYKQQFESFPQPIRDQILRGAVAVGFTPLQVYLALGAPNRSREFAPPPVEDGDTWTYLGIEKEGRFFTSKDPVILPSRGLEEMKITFDGGRVSRIETVDTDS